VIVIDASAMAEFLLQTPLGSRVEERLFRNRDDFHAPHLLDVEVAQALRRLVRTGEVPAERAEEALADLAAFDVHRHPHTPILDRAWELRSNLTAYDAMYVVLAEAIDAALVTCDGPLGETPGHAARIEVIR
jgi:predicted nucleic acid-binding protein